MMKILFFIYDIIFTLGLFIYLPVYFLRKKINLFACGYKFGFIPHYTIIKKSIWIHTVSVGEANVAEGIIQYLKKCSSDPIIISTTTLTGYDVAQKKYGAFARIVFFPFDISFPIEVFINRVKPKIFIALESEIWPQLFYRLWRKKIPIIIVNGRISDRVFARYLKNKWFIGRIMALCDYVGVQNTNYKDRFIALGCSHERVKVTGNMKFERALPDENKLNEISNKYSGVLKNNNVLLFVAGSTHSPEEEYLLDAFQTLGLFQKNIRLLIAPRHIERIPALEKTILSRKLQSVKITDLNRGIDSSHVVFLLNTIGELIYFYSLADICFVGGSLIPHGGQNILEPIYFAKPTIFGPYMDNFREIESVVLEKNAGIKVHAVKELQKVMERVVNDNALRRELSTNCSKVFEYGQGSLKKNIDIILKFL